MTDVSHGVGEILIDATSVKERVDALGAEISADYAGQDLLLVGVLKGAVFFMADLMRELSIPCEIDFMAISELRRRNRLLGGRANPQGSRHQHRRPQRDRGRGHHRLRAHACRT